VCRVLRPVLKKVEPKRSSKFKLSWVVQLLKTFFLILRKRASLAGRAALELRATILNFFIFPELKFLRTGYRGQLSEFADIFIFFCSWR
jgi:hypothetical protein